MRVAPIITLTAEQRTTLQRWSRGRTTPARLVRRAQIVLLAAEGRQNKDIAEEPVSYTHLDVYKRQALAEGVARILPPT